MPIAVIGMHRSGTSMVSRLANLAGLFIGDADDLLPATEHNEAGHWEPGWICDLNDEALAESGGTWHAPPIGKSCGSRNVEWSRLKAQAQSAVGSYFADHDAWGWKDPRTTLLLPFWRSVVPDLKFIVCVRNPLDVAGSLARRDGMRLSHALALWHFYTETALRETEPHERILVHYESFFQDRGTALSRLFGFLGQHQAAPAGPKAEEVTRFVDSNLRHHCHTLFDLLEHEDVPEYTKKFYRSVWEAGKTDAAVELSDPDSWASLTSTMDMEGRRHVSLEICRMRHVTWEMRRLYVILDSPALALAFSTGRMLHRRMPPLYRFARRYAPTVVPTTAKPATD